MPELNEAEKKELKAVREIITDIQRRLNSQAAKAAREGRVSRAEERCWTILLNLRLLESD